jgi:hypothetical protein
MTEKAWKRAERNVARALGGEQLGAKMRGVAVIDVTSGRFVVEVAHRQEPIAYIDHELGQAERAAMLMDGNKVPIAVIHYAGTHTSSALVVMRFGRFLKFLDESSASAVSAYAEAIVTG